jgi:hypothetical protein
VEVEDGVIGMGTIWKAGGMEVARFVIRAGRGLPGHVRPVSGVIPVTPGAEEV